MTSPAAMRDPFGLTADPQGYVPRDATEAALAALVATLREGRRPAALVGPPGLGKTLLLHLVAQRLDDRLRPVYLPYAALPLDELCGWALSLLGFSHSDDTIGDLIQTATQLLARGSGLLLLVDDAGAMPLATTRKLGDLVAASRGALRLVVAAAEGPTASRMLAATGANVHVVRLLEPMSAAETGRYIAARLARAGIPLDMAARFDDAALASIHRLSAGIPRRVHGVASAVLRGVSPEAGAHAFEALEAAESAAEQEAAQIPVVPTPAPSRKAEIAPALEALREAVPQRPFTRVEAAPGVGIVFATALVCGALFLAVERR
jgi:type II secretory pathway predicted ATPase ExeA